LAFFFIMQPFKTGICNHREIAIIRRRGVLYPQPIVMVQSK
jgi:hypothetical protein